MNSGYRSYGRLTLAVASSRVLSPLVASLVACLAPTPGIADRTSTAQPVTAAARTWPMLGGTPQRNMVNAVEKNIPAQWDIKEGAQKNIKWVAQIGMRGYGCAIVSGGKVFVATHNHKPREPHVKGDKALLVFIRAS